MSFRCCYTLLTSHRTVILSNYYSFIPYRHLSRAAGLKPPHMVSFSIRRTMTFQSVLTSLRTAVDLSVPANARLVHKMLMGLAQGNALCACGQR
jgi:hypothetical protein|eukprot:COSAG03_NODE_1546_length_3897_cov_105.656925_2_plen_94_part_00